jgi:deoxyadenosine/deoxycytidine kinase
VIAGAIAVGKSALARELAERLDGAELVEEAAEELVFLPRFYAEPARWSFHSRMELLSHKAELWAAERGAATALYDRGMHELITFARVLERRGELARDELAVYERLYGVLVAALPAPDLVVWVRCDTDECLRRVRARGRPFEQGVTAGYLDALDAEYRAWFDGLPGERAILHDTTEGSPHSIDDVVRRVLSP